MLSPLQIVPAEVLTITVGNALIVRLNVAVAASVSVYVTVYVEAVEAEISITPVVEFIIKPVVELNVPAPALLETVGVGSLASAQKELEA